MNYTRKNRTSRRKTGAGPKSKATKTNTKSIVMPFRTLDHCMKELERSREDQARINATFVREFKEQNKQMASMKKDNTLVQTQLKHQIVSLENDILKDCMICALQDTNNSMKLADRVKPFTGGRRSAAVMDTRSVTIVTQSEPVTLTYTELLERLNRLRDRRNDSNHFFFYDTKGLTPEQIHTVNEMRDAGLYYLYEKFQEIQSKESVIWQEIDDETGSLASYALQCLREHEHNYNTQVYAQEKPRFDRWWKHLPR